MDGRNESIDIAGSERMSAIGELTKWRLAWLGWAKAPTKRRSLKL